MAQEEDKSYYRINDPDKEEPSSEVSTGEKRSKKKLIIIISSILIVCIAVAVLLLVLLLKGSDDSIPSGYNGFVLKNDTNLKYKYLARISRDNEADYPVTFDDNNKEFKDIDFSICMMTGKTFRISYRPTKEAIGSNNTRWTVPDYLLERLECDKTKLLSFGDFNVDKSPFGFTLKNPAHKNTFWLSTKDRNLVLSEKYIECGFEVHSQEVFGWGERTSKFKLDFGEYSIWATGVKKGIDKGVKGFNTNGDHPFVLARLTDKTYLGLFFKNSNAKVLKYIKEPNGKSVINFKSIGGIIDVFAFMGTTADEVLYEYHRVIGTPFLPPLWALGFHQGSSGYKNETLARKSVDNYAKSNIPLEALWIDESYMKKYRMWTVDKENFPTIKEFVTEMNNKHQRLGISLHPGLATTDETGKPYSFFEAAKKDALIKTPRNTTEYGDIFIGKHLPGKCAYYDFESPLGGLLWANNLVDLQANIPFSSIQLNYNEITHFCDGDCGSKASPLEGKYDNLPFNPLGDGQNLQTQALPLDAIIHSYYNDSKNESVVYNYHSLYGNQQAYYMFDTLVYNYNIKEPKKRALVLSRSTFPGSGEYTGHWIDVQTTEGKMTFDDLRYSVSSIMSFQIFGIPMSGANIWGSSGELNQEICGRWYQLGSFYPLARSFPNDSFGTREAWALEDKYKKAARNALVLRLSLLRYYYTVFFEIYKYGGSFWRPIFFEFPESDESLKDIEQTFLIGESLKVTPVLQPVSASEKIKSYVPANTKFISLIDWKTIIDGGSSGSYAELEPSWDFPLVHLREGRIIPYQTFNESQTTFELAERYSINLLIYPDEYLDAEGTVYVDRNGLDYFEVYENLFEYYKITYNDRKIRVVLMDGDDNDGRPDMNQFITNVTIIDAGIYNDTNFACMFNENMESEEIGFEYNPDKKILNLFSKPDGSSMILKTLKNIQFGNNNTDQNFCNPKYFVSNVEYVISEPFAEKKVNVQLKPNFKGLYPVNATFTLIKDNLINADFHLQKDIKEFEIPSAVLNSTLYPVNTTYAKTNISSYLTLPNKDEEFYFEIHTKDKPSDVFYSTKGQHFVYSEYYKAMGSKVDTKKLFGLGERVSDFWLTAGTYTVWNRAGDQIVDNGEPPGKNLYSSHPVYFAQRQSTSDFFAVYHHNSGPQDFVLEPGQNGYEINTVTTTGRMNLFFLISDKISNVVKNYYELVGKPALQPEWAFGWHQSRYGYNSTQALKEVYDGYRSKHFPLDAIWSDVDYQDDFRDFTVDKVNYKALKEFVSEIKSNGTRYVPIIGAGISAGDSDAYFEGMKQDVFIKSFNDKSEPIYGRSTPGECVFVDFLMDKSYSFWDQQLNTLFSLVEFDGVWLDMNEVSSYCDGYCYFDQKVLHPIDSKLFYWPGGRDLEDRTIILDAVHNGDTFEIDTHNAYGLLQSHATSKWFTKKGQRPFIISRSTFAGSGKYSGHWTGDNKAEYEMLKYSINSIFEFNFFGIPFTGADICGFNGNTTAMLCSVWYKLAAIYPFARNHGNFDTIPQEPFREMFNETVDYGNNKKGYDVMRMAFYIRYGLHVYTYTQFHKASTDGVPVFKPLFFNYPEDINAYDQIALNVLIGDSIKSSTDSDVFPRNRYYFPEPGATWCPIWESLYTQCFTGGSFQSISVPVSEVLLHLKSGTIVPLQLTDSTKFVNITNVNNLDDLAKNYKTDLAVLLNGDKKATGDVRFDGGVTTDLTLYDEIKFSAVTGSPFFSNPYMDISFNVTSQKSTGQMTASQQLGDVIIYNADDFGFVDASFGTIQMKNGGSIQIKTQCNTVRNVCRVSHDGTKQTALKEITKIHIEIPK